MGTDLRGWLWMLQKAIRVFPCDPWFINSVACQKNKMLQVSNAKIISAVLCVFAALRQRQQLPTDRTP
jgi:hypothetical protein